MHFFCEARLSFSFFSFHHPLLNHLFIILLHVSREWSALILEFLFLLFYYPKEFAVNSPQRRRFQTIRGGMVVVVAVVAVDNLHVNGPLLTSLASVAALALLYCTVQPDSPVRPPTRASRKFRSVVLSLSGRFQCKGGGGAAVVFFSLSFFLPLSGLAR